MTRRRWLLLGAGALVAVALVLAPWSDRWDTIGYDELGRR